MTPPDGLPSDANGGSVRRAASRKPQPNGGCSRPPPGSLPPTAAGSARGRIAILSPLPVAPRGFHFASEQPLRSGHLSRGLGPVVRRPTTWGSPNHLAGPAGSENGSSGDNRMSRTSVPLEPHDARGVLSTDNAVSRLRLNGEAASCGVRSVRPFMLLVPLCPFVAHHQV